MTMEYPLLRGYVIRYCLNKKYKDPVVISKLTESLFNKMGLVREDESALIDLLVDHILLPTFLKPIKDQMVSLITSDMIVEMIECYTSDGGIQTFHSIVDPVSEEVLSELSCDDYSEMVHYIDDMSSDGDDF